MAHMRVFSSSRPTIHPDWGMGEKYDFPDGFAYVFYNLNYVRDDGELEVRTMILNINSGGIAIDVLDHDNETIGSAELTTVDLEEMAK